jgi:short-chain Z-isoprenyl diphosphate synthase
MRNGAHLLFYTLRELIKLPFYWLYRYRLVHKAKRWKLPDHIGIIMDGNRRFARKSGLMSIGEGHRRGADKLHEVLNWVYEFKIPVITVWGFSLDNFQRDTDEVEGLLDLIETKFLELIDHEDIHHNQVKVRYLGAFDRLPESLKIAIRKAEAATEHYDAYVLNIAIAYDGREELTDAFRSHIREQGKQGKDVEQVAEELEAASIGPYLYTAGLPEPDLILRTSGEVRLSGFLLWQSAYSEFYFCDTYWPAFRKIDFLRALRAYDLRKRRFGR